jgi:hypothetical protein
VAGTALGREERLAGRGVAEVVAPPPDVVAPPPDVVAPPPDVVAPPPPVEPPPAGLVATVPVPIVMSVWTVPPSLPELPQAAAPSPAARDIARKRET